MALILEVLAHGRHAEVRERRALNAAFTIGRALDNDLVLDDPHVDAHHARLEEQPEGGWVLVDLGSVNRIGVAGDGRTDRVALVPGAVVTLGRTTLRIRAAEAPVPPALPLREVMMSDADPGPARLAGAGRRLGSVAGALALAGGTTWMHATQRGIASQIFGELLLALVMLCIWAGIWSIAARVVLGRFHFLLHAAIAAIAFAVLTLKGTFTELVNFLAPAFTQGALLDDFVMFVLLAVLIAAHLGGASHLSRAARRAAGLIAAGVVVGLLWTSKALEDDRFTAAAEFNGTILTLSPSVVPQQTMAQFSETRASLHAQVDALLSEQAASPSPAPLPSTARPPLAAPTPGPVP